MMIIIDVNINHQSALGMDYYKKIIHRRLQKSMRIAIEVLVHRVH